MNSLVKQLEEEEIDELENEDGSEDDSEQMCGYCNGSGEGQYDGTRCSHCKGKGVIYSKDED